MKKQKENSLENITWSEMGKQNVQAKKVYKTACSFLETDDCVIYLERKCIIIVLSSHYEQQTPTQAHKRSHPGSLKPRQQGHN